MSAPPSSSRPLAPAPSPSPVRTDSSSVPPSTVSNNSLAGIKRASTACQSCKQIKRKCDQALPCSNCRKSQTRCIYNEADDGRRKAARKRTVESLELKRDALECILELLRTSDDQHVQTLVQLIKSQAPLEDVVQYAASHAEQLPDSELRTITNVVSGQPRRGVLSVSDLCDTPMVRVPAQPWTTVTDDDEFVSHLISIYFIWFHIAYPVMDKDLFLRDMEAGNTDAQFCSPFLVNAMLAMACHFTDHPRACKVLSDPNTRGRHFLDEATRLWHKQEGRPSVSNIQAILIQAVSSTLAGKDRLSWVYVEQASTMFHEVAYKTSQAEARGTPISPEMQRSQYLTSWTRFLLAVGYGIAFMKPLPAILPTAIGIAPHPVLDVNLSWFPYPQRTPEVSIAFSVLHKAYCSLHLIGSDIQRLHFGDTPNVSSQELDQRLQDWKRTLHELVQIRIDLHPIKPPIMDLHLTYHWFRITLFNFSKKPRSTPTTPPDEVDPTQLHTRSQIIESASAIADLCRRYHQDFGLKQVTIWMPQTSASAAYSLIDMLSDPHQGAFIQDTFHELCLVLIAASQRWLVMKGHVRMLFMTAEEKGQKLAAKTKALLRFVALEKWGEKDHLQFASALYPNYALAKDEDPRSVAMGDLLEKWADFGHSDFAEDEE